MTKFNMTAQGFIYTVLMYGKDYFYRPTEGIWTADMKKISLGDIYFTNKLVQLRMGNPDHPDMSEWPKLPTPDKRTIKISI